MRKPSPGAVNRLFEGDLNRDEKVAGKRGCQLCVLMSSSTEEQTFLFETLGSDYYVVSIYRLSLRWKIYLIKLT